MERLADCSFYFGLVSPIAFASKACFLLNLLAAFFTLRSMPNELRQRAGSQRFKVALGLLPPGAERLPGAKEFQIRMRWIVFTQAFILVVNVALLLALRVCA